MVGEPVPVPPLEAALAVKDTGGRIIPNQSPRLPRDAESLDVWGFRDSGFRVLQNGSVILTGSRYALSGMELPDLLPWMRKIFGVDLPIHDTHDSAYPP